MELFNPVDNTRSPLAPLSKRMMPRTLDEFAGQAHLVGPGKPVRTMVERGVLHSMIFYGPPATGKTSLANIIAKSLDCRFVTENALTLDAEGIRKLLHDSRDAADAGKRTIVFIDEIHRLTRPKQDAFLPALENGEVTVIGATTENPYFIVVPAFRSRVFIYEFKPHGQADLARLLDRALAADPVLSRLPLAVDEGARETLLTMTGDPRRMLNALEMAVLSKPAGETISVSREDVLEILQNADTRYDRESAHYDAISAFIKSVRGSDVDAAIYWLAVMIAGGEDPLFIARRLVILAAEDIGLAYPEGLAAAVAAYHAVENIGMPEGRIVLAEATALLAGVPKSNSAYRAVDTALADVRANGVQEVPPYLRSASYSGAEELGRGIGYVYPHENPNHWAKQAYTLKPVKFYEPGNLGFEKKISDWMKTLKGEKPE
jgi:putative ATPase